MTIIYILLLLISSVLTDSTKLNPLSDEFINYINSKQSTWIAGRNFDENTPMNEIKKLLGTIKLPPHQQRSKIFYHDEDMDIPESFDAREQWPDCKSVISTIADQSACGSCWAVAAASVMTDRRCIISSGELRTPISAIDLLECCYYCGGGCRGGSIENAWYHWFENGIVTGGLYNSSEGCKTYPFEPCEHHMTGDRKPCTDLSYDNPTCSFSCEDSSINYKKDLTFGKTAGLWFQRETDIQKEILLNGPVEAGFDVYSDFLSYKSGVYQHVAGDAQDGHAVRIIGWGIENDVPYWLIANSWNVDWGNNGYFKILRGKNEVGIESTVFASVPKV